MKNLNWDEFLQGGVNVHCDTEEKANDFLKECHKRGLKWCDGDSLIESNEYYNYEGRTVYVFEENGIAFDGICSLNSNDKIIKWEMDENMSKPFIELINNESGDWSILRLNMGEDFEYGSHSISNHEWIRLLNVLGYKVEVKEISDEDMEEGNY